MARALKTEAPAKPLLLEREEFKRLVFARSGGRCVFCARPAMDAHHILERKLFADGGYYLDNGAAVCEDHHWDCETTRLSLEVVRAAAGITRAILPDGWPREGVRWDKWGNRIWPSGYRSAGPLIDDTGARRALVAGAKLHLLMPADYTEPLPAGVNRGNEK